MKRLVLLLVLAMFFGWCRAAQAATSAELIANAKAFDGTAVAYEGEVIGEILDRGDHVWLNVYDGSSAIGVWADKLQAASVKRPGDYHHRGDGLHVEGIFRRACPEHGGVIDIHAVTISVVVPGAVIPERMSTRKMMGLAVLLGVLSCLLILHLFHGKRKHR